MLLLVQWKFQALWAVSVFVEKIEFTSERSELPERSEERSRSERKLSWGALWAPHRVQGRAPTHVLDWLISSPKSCPLKTNRSWEKALIVIVLVGINATCLHFMPRRILKNPEYELAGPFGTMPQEPWHPKRASAMLNQSRDPPHIRGSAHLCKLNSARTVESTEHREKKFSP